MFKHSAVAPPDEEYLSLRNSRSRSVSDSSGSVVYEVPTQLENTLVEIDTESGNSCKGYFSCTVRLRGADGSAYSPMVVVVPNHGLELSEKEGIIGISFQETPYFGIRTGWSAPYLDSLVYLTNIPVGDSVCITSPYDIDFNGLGSSARVSLPLLREKAIQIQSFSLVQNHDSDNVILSKNAYLFSTQHTDSQGRAYAVRYAHIRGDFRAGDSGTPVFIHYKPDYRLFGVLSYQNDGDAKVIIAGQQADHELFGEFIPQGDLQTQFTELTKKKPFVPPTYSIGGSYTDDHQAVDSPWVHILAAFETLVTNAEIGHHDLYSTRAKSFGLEPTVRGHHQDGSFKLYLDAELGAGTRERAIYTIDSHTHKLTFSHIFTGH